MLKRDKEKPFLHSTATATATATGFSKQIATKPKIATHVTLAPIRSRIAPSVPNSRSPISSLYLHSIITTRVLQSCLANTKDTPSLPRQSSRPLKGRSTSATSPLPPPQGRFLALMSSTA
jgi:hypothetical protein